MILHKYKCIFIHIPRTGGSSIEIALDGIDWFKKRPEEKHLVASQARKLYGENIWKSYFKFSFVRNPWDRIISLWLRPRIGKNRTLKEFVLTYKPLPHEPQSPFYSDIIDLDIDFVGRYENLQRDFDKISGRLAIKRKKMPLAVKTFQKVKHYSQYYDRETQEMVRKIYARDIKRFDYKFENKRTPPPEVFMNQARRIWRRLEKKLKRRKRGQHETAGNKKIPR